MKLTLTIDYRTAWGETLHVSGDIVPLRDCPAMALTGTRTWSLEIDVPDGVDAFTYRYIVRHDSGSVRNEWGAPHRFVRGNAIDNMSVCDRWQEMPWNKAFYSTAFTDCINRREHRTAAPAPRRQSVTLRIPAPMIRPDEVLAVTGETDGLGSWNPRKAILLSDAAFPEWEITLDLAVIPAGTQYKFIILKSADKSVVAWENGDNRIMPHYTPANADAVVVNCAPFQNPSAPWRGAGTAIPVFSVRTESDFGVGDFIDLKEMVDWCAQTGQTFLQLLPINDTTMTGTWTDSYPYNANSTFALHPMYLRLQELGTLKDAKRMKYYNDLAAELNALPEIDYERVNEGKMAYCREIFAQEGKKVVASADFAAFVSRNEGWLPNYAAFCVLRDKNGTADFAKWGEYAQYTPEKVAKVIKDNKDDINFVYYLQYCLDKQMKSVRDYAHTKGVAIKGDIPIGISRTSVDAWTDARLFNMDCQAGAPPDDFSVLGQNWGFPTYNWDEMSKDGFAWWKNRLRKMSEYFDAYRIDHVLGFFRIWQIPMDAVHGLLGYFNPALPFTPDELRNNYDFWLNVEVQTKPYIMDWFLGDFFGEFTDEVRDKYLEPLGYGRYRLLPQYDTQRKVVEYFAALPQDDKEETEKNNRICNGLLGLIDEVLFIEDPYEKGKYHPRISAQFTYAYRSLNDYEKYCFNRLYNDFFYRRNTDFWYGKAMWKLPPLVEATQMLCCAEDLGMIPACVPAVMDKLGILSLEIQRMPKDPKAEFGNTWTYPYLSVCTTSTHDMGGIRQWWEEDRQKTRDFYNNVLHEHGPAPYYCEPWICRRIIDLHLKSPSMLCIIPLQDYMAMDGDLRRKDPREEQINVPANPRHYWRYRMHLPVSRLSADVPFNKIVAEMIHGDGR
ncbi:MAG: 4-alpha-glucanotransferase [Bacteroidales bacterium]|nr:4-alpha-glucanotransferase [Bacteroidales bacterium]